MSHSEVLVIHAAATWFMTGLIWFVQLVHYPLMAMADRETWIEFEKRHQERTTWIVGPVMFVEMLATIVILVWQQENWTKSQQSLAVGGTAALIVAWLSTFAVQVPLHTSLSKGFSARTHRVLVRSNWVRTAAWTCRAVFAGMLLAKSG